MSAPSIRGAGLLVAATALFALTVSASARADTVTDWNAIATTAIVTTAAQSPAGLDAQLRDGAGRRL